MSSACPDEHIVVKPLPPTAAVEGSILSRQSGTFLYHPCKHARSQREYGGLTWASSSFSLFSIAINVADLIGMSLGLQRISERLPFSLYTSPACRQKESPNDMGHKTNTDAMRLDAVNTAPVRWGEGLEQTGAPFPSPFAGTALSQAVDHDPTLDTDVSTWEGKPCL